MDVARAVSHWTTEDVLDWQKISALCQHVLRARILTKDPLAGILSDPSLQAALADTQHCDLAPFDLVPRPAKDNTTVLFSLDDVVVLPNADSDETHITIHRIPIDGYPLADRKRTDVVTMLKTDEQFRKVFEERTAGVLGGLDWSNILVAGGIVLGSLFNTLGQINEHALAAWHKSDIDVFFYGLSGDALDAKLRHILEVFVRNLPDGAPSCVVRTARTVTIYSTYPARRVQVILKAAPNAASILQNFDLDVCAVGWNGSNVVLESRAIHAICTGYNSFAIPLVRGDPYGFRKGTRFQRIVKYASRGYGLEIPKRLYEDPEVVRVALDSNPLVDLAGLLLRDDCVLDMDEIRSECRRITQGLVNIERARQDRLRILVRERPILGLKNPMSSLRLMLRHLELWNMDQTGQVTIRYDEGQLNGIQEDPSDYDDYPTMFWMDDQDQEAMEYRVEIYNQDCIAHYEDLICAAFSEDVVRRNAKELASLSQQVQAIVFADGTDMLERVLSNEIRIPLLLPNTLATYIGAIVQAIFPGSASPTILSPVSVVLTNNDNPTVVRNSALGLYLWQLPTKLTWELQNPVVDEIFDMLDIFRRLGVNSFRAGRDAPRWLLRQLSRRDVYAGEQGEVLEFVKWAGQDPAMVSTPFFTLREYDSVFA